MSSMDKKDDRISLRINRRLKRKMQKYCTRHGVDMSEIVTRVFERLVRKEEERNAQCPT